MRDANRNHHVYYASIKGKKLKYQKGVTFLAHTVHTLTAVIQFKSDAKSFI